MIGDLIHIDSKDGLILHGFHAVEPGRRSSVVIHVHGSYGNFFENFFLEEMARSYTQAGVGLLSIGTRGRDYYADFKRKSEGAYSSRRIGGILEIFQECTLDLEAWVGFARDSGYQRIVLQGHSLGAMKAIYSASRGLKVEGLVLLSPPDNFGLQERDFGPEWTDFLTSASTLAQSDSTALMPSNAYYDPISSAAFLSLLGTPTDTGMFTYADPELMEASGLARIASPVLAPFGTIDEAVVGPVPQCASVLRSVLQKYTDVDVRIVEGANHPYHFRERELASVVLSWLESKGFSQ